MTSQWLQLHKTSRKDVENQESGCLDCILLQFKRSSFPLSIKSCNNPSVSRRGNVRRRRFSLKLVFYRWDLLEMRFLNINFINFYHSIENAKLEWAQLLRKGIQLSLRQALPLLHRTQRPAHRLNRIRRDPWLQWGLAPITTKICVNKTHVESSRTFC